MRQRKIGGEFDVDPWLLSEPAAARWTSVRKVQVGLCSSGRGAFAAIAGKPEMRRRQFLFPDYLCEAQILTAVAMRLKFAFYKLKSDLSPEMESFPRSRQGKKLAIVVVSYFGLVNLEKIILEIRHGFPDAVIIEDKVQSLFSTAIDETDYFYTSFRKFLPLPDGGEAFSRGRERLGAAPAGLNAFAAVKLIGALIKAASLAAEKPGGKLDSIYLQYFRLGEELLNRQRETVPMSLVSWHILNNLNMDQVIQRRCKNYRYLAKRIESLGIEVPFLCADCVPLCLPIRIPGRDRIRAQLMKCGVFLPIHWPVPKLLANNDSMATRMFRNELSLVIDQRYDEEDMERLFKAFRSALGGHPEHRRHIWILEPKPGI